MLLFVLLLPRARIESTTWLAVTWALQEMGTWIQRPLAGPDRRLEIPQARCRGVMQLQCCAPRRLHAFQTCCSPNDALGSGRDILESALVLASAAECVSADLSGEVFDMIYLPAGAFVENFELEWLWGASPQIEKSPRLSQVQPGEQSLEKALKRAILEKVLTC